MTRLFKRGVALTLARPQAGKFFENEPNAITIRDLRVQFSIVKDLDSEPNTCDVMVTNLAERTRAEVARLPLHVRLDAGYDGELARIFTGDVIWGQSKLNGVDWETKLQLGDGSRAHGGARLNRSFKAGTSAKTVLGDLAKAHGLKLPTSIADAKELSAQFASGVTVSGPTHTELTKVLAPRGYGWSVQDGRLQILSGTGTRPDEAIVINQDAGMIGSPEFGPPGDEGKPPTMTVSVLLYPRITPGGKIKVESRSVNGLFRVERVTHVGDTHGQSWQSNIEAIPL